MDSARHFKKIVTSDLGLAQLTETVSSDWAFRLFKQAFEKIYEHAPAKDWSNRGERGLPPTPNPERLKTLHSDTFTAIYKVH